MNKRLISLLLVDDDPGLLRLLSIRLRAEMYDVEAVESAHKALANVIRLSVARRRVRNRHNAAVPDLAHFHCAFDDTVALEAERSVHTVKSALSQQD